MLQKLKRLIYSCNMIGVKQTGLIIKHRMKRNRFITCMKGKALNYEVHHTWDQLSRRYNLSLDVLCKQTLPYVGNLFVSIDEQQFIEMSNKYADNQFQVLGSDWYALDETMWHTDIRLKQQGGTDYLFADSAFYADIHIESGNTEVINKDIKVSWELARLQHLPLLAQAYKREQDNKYVKAFMHHIEHWQKHNPYLIGINWLCPMEVALRSISLVIAFDGFKQADVPVTFWQKYVALLYDHMFYLEHNWEWYDGRTSNHYLSDLVGYLYLCYFFQSCNNMNKKIDWCIKEILRECDKQIFAEGTSYEGSTKYHVLVTELLYHVELLSVSMDITLPQSFHQKLVRMFEFIDWCSINESDMIHIGDHDAGRVTWAGLPKMNMHTLYKRKHIKHFNQFGLSIFRSDTWHVSLRHHAYISRQPSGHYHNDAGSITLAIKGIPVLVDPASFVYTASSVWRNKFRSACVHNVMRVAGHEPVPFDERLFALNMPDHIPHIDGDEKNILKARHRLYERFGLIYNREILVQDKAVFISDVWNKSSVVQEDLFSFFNLTFSPNIVIRKEKACWVGFHNGEPLFRLVSDLDLRTVRGYVSPTYGIKQETMRLCAQAPLKVARVYTSRLILM